MALKRGHWAIENRLHRRKDVTFGEDASLIHVGQGPTVMALLRDRDGAISLHGFVGVIRVMTRDREPWLNAPYAISSLRAIMEIARTNAGESRHHVP